MKMFKSRLLFVIVGMIFMQTSHAEYSMEQISNLRNDKEVLVRSIKKKERREIAERFSNSEDNKRIAHIFYLTIKEFLDLEDKQCELRLIDLIKKRFEAEKLDVSEEGLLDLFKMLRVTNAIDDVLYDILDSVNKDFNRLGDLKISRKKLSIQLPRKKLLEKNDLPTLFSGFTTWPDETTRCIYQEYIYVKNHVANKDGVKSKKNSHFRYLTKKALKEKVIDLETYNKLDYLQTKSTVNDRKYWVGDYLKIIFNAKNKMRPISSTYVVRNLEDEDGYSTERIKRFSRLTRRKLLYRKYNETQIILLAQQLQKASRRMGVDPDTKSMAPIISQEFHTLNESGIRETYVETIELDPQSQYNLARRLLRKDMTELQMMEIFIGLKITHEDVVMAAFETVYFFGSRHKYYLFASSLEYYGFYSCRSD
jgi:hypothetical protein